MFSKILIANRGEIALRIIRACKEMGIKTVAIYSVADKDSLHVRMADEAVCVGPAAPSASYLNIPAVISAAEITDVEAIHPGYGFLSENAHFAEICESCQIAFIGPSPQNIRLLGDKMAAKETMSKAGLPITPGSNSVVKTKEEALKIARRIKYPVIIKATAGGGGRGMRICHNDIRLISSLMTAQAEAEKAFGVQDVYIEKYIEEPRHVEFQIIADHYGNVIHLGERDCSIQRRHQKLLEESPSSALDSKLRKKIGDLVIKGVKAAGYRNVGTIEFLLDKEKNFYFMEMNTRIQVEHPVTEMVTGIDLIKEQIKIAAGEKLKIRQEDVKIEGAAMECRINAEDPQNNFMPSPGRIETLNLPGGPRVRIDTHVYQGYQISPHYDSMVAKLIVHRENRHEVIKTMLRALDEFVIEPIKTTIPFHKQLLNHPSFRKGDISTHFIEQILKTNTEGESKEAKT
ncbi:acetyl-CoA carboxylase biotin carboxylase subunit [Candidatus Velamenicoccus archaeovorus]|uniref:Biotin carboxylase n=1 Tax=Velamenicoccus archaeovorus TaxID=1930593 RepID=A0A410P424_VELA1|nr:acetyl-CoA carboxylase biotin carboxylase subunit [Candidatus Velamenicoccus archaeovorus]QAT16916.1 acetyl-CoA carboxylase biotin carboxylase subunit [Candidatus Velamenicoccus archaeovorus]